MYEQGHGVEMDYKEAVRWYRLAAEQGFSDAQYFLAGMYDRGLGVTQSFTEAVRWHKLAAAQGNTKAQYNLGNSYGKAEGVSQDDIRAHMWYNLSAGGGYAAAVKLRDIVAARMTIQQIADAQKLAKKCLESNYKDCD